jgi:protein disulfide-isomerase
MNCIAFGDACVKNGIRSWPSLMMYRNGEFIDKYTGSKSIPDLSHYIEEKLEQIRPGSRPLEGLKVPEVGANSVDRTALPETPLAKNKDAAAGVAAGVKHNDQAAALADATNTAMLSSETAKTVRTKDASRTGPAPNPQGTSIDLTAESFQKRVTTTQDAWFIKFYAPWCGHCRALAPTWSQMATELKGQLNVGEVNCDLESYLCKDARIKGYPTMHYFRGGERVEYDGLRGLGDLLSFARKALDSDVKYVDAAKFQEMEETEEVIFTFFFDHATTSEDFAALDRLTLSLIGHAKIVKTDSPELAKRFEISTWPRLLVSRDGRASYYTALAPKDMRDSRKVLTWMQSVWLPIVPELTIPNALDILSNKFVVLGILSRNRPDDFIQSKRELKSAALQWMDKQTKLFQLERQGMRDAKQLKIDEAEDRNDQRALRQAKSQRIGIREEDFRKPVTFAWVDGVFWERWLRTTYGVDLSNGDQVIINDEEVCYKPSRLCPIPPLGSHADQPVSFQNKRYWDTTTSGAFIRPLRTSIIETLSNVISSPPQIQPKSTIGTLENVFFQIRQFASYHPSLALGLLFAAVVALALLLKRKMKSAARLAGGGGILHGVLGVGAGNAGGYFKLDGKEGLLSGMGVGATGDAEKAD